MQGPCMWPINVAVLPDSTFWNALDEELRTLAMKAATEFLWRWTGRRFGLCPGKIRPCRTDSCRTVPHRISEPYDTAVVKVNSPWLPVVLGSKTYPLGCGSCQTSCNCVEHPGIRLPRKVHSVTEVKVDGVVLDASQWAFYNHVLYRTDGQSWPTYQDVLASSDEEGTWEISVEFGEPVPSGGVVAVTLLAEQIAQAMLGRNSCSLPERVQSVSREGISVVAYDSLEDAMRGGTGIWLIDSWVASIMKAPSGSAVYSPDFARCGGGYRV